MEIDLHQTALLLTRQDDILLLTHKRPDGDTVGSAAALCRLLRQLGKRAFLLPNEDLTPRLGFLAQGLEAAEGFVPRFVTAVDIADEALLPPSALSYRGHIDLCVDHHPSNRHYAAAEHVEPGAAATGEIIYQLAEQLGVTPDQAGWEALYVAVATDTGCFRFSNTTPLSHELAARCIAAGVDFHRHNHTFFEAKSKVRFQIERRMFDRMCFSDDGRIACSWLDRAWLDSIGATDDDMDNLSTLTMALEGVDCGIILTENRDRKAYKVSVRTHKPADASRICQQFDGGGHPRAAGCTLTVSGEEAARLLTAAAEQELARC